MNCLRDWILRRRISDYTGLRRKKTLNYLTPFNVPTCIYLARLTHFVKVIGFIRTGEWRYAKILDKNVTIISFTTVKC